MKGGARIGASAAGLVVAGVLLWWLLGSGGPEGAPPVDGPDAGGGAVAPIHRPTSGAGDRGSSKGGDHAAGGGAAPDAPEAPSAGPTFAIRGIVRDGSGRPVAGAAVEARDAAMDLRRMDFFFILRLVADDSPPLAGATTDAEGRFALRRVPGDRVLLRARAAGLCPGFTAPLSPALQPPDHLEEIVLGPGFPVRGRVFLSGGAPVEGAVLRLLPEPRDPTFLLHRTEAVTDAEGKFLLESLPAGDHYIAFISAPGHAVRIFDGIEVPARDPVAIEIPAGGSLLVAVRGPGGAPVEGASVLAISGKREGAFARGTTDAGGRALLGGMEPGSVKGVLVSRAGFVSFVGGRGSNSPAEKLPTIVEGETAEIAVDLSRGGTVRGKVLDAGTERPVAGAVVRATGDRFEGLMAGSAHAVSGPDGAYRLEAVGEGRTTLLVQAAGFAPVRAGRGEPPDDRYTVTVGEGGEVEKDLRIERAASVSGLVTKPDRTPASFAAVRIAGDRDFFDDAAFASSGMEGFADADGRFRFDSLPPGKPARVHASLTGYLPAVSDEVKAAAGQAVEEMALRLGTGLSIEGVVRGDAGRPIGGALVSSKPEEGEGGDRREAGPGTLADATGRFVLRGVAPGKHMVGVAAPGFVPAKKGLEVAEGRSATVEFALEPAASVAGRVTDEAGTPVPGASVEVEASGESGVGGKGSARSEEDGNFEVRDLPARGTYDLKATADGFLPGERKGVPGGARGVVVVLPAGAAISGRVLDPEGRPVAGAGVRLRREPRGQETWGKTGEDGSFEFRGLAEGEYVLRPTDGGGDPDLILEDFPKVAAGTRGMDLRLRRGLRITGRVVDGQGRGVGNVQLSARTGESGISKSTRTEPGGAFTIHGLPEGTCTLRASQGGILDASLEGIAAGATEVVVRVRMGLVLTGTVVDKDGKPPGGPARVALRRQGRPQVTIFTDREGRFRFDGLPEGEVEVGAWKPTDGGWSSNDPPESGWVLLRAGDEGVRISVP